MQLKRQKLNISKKKRDKVENNLVLEEVSETREKPNEEVSETSSFFHVEDKDNWENIKGDIELVEKQYTDYITSKSAGSQEDLSSEEEELIVDSEEVLKESEELQVESNMESEEIPEETAREPVESNQSEEEQSISIEDQIEVKSNRDTLVEVDEASNVGPELVYSVQQGEEVKSKPKKKRKKPKPKQELKKEEKEKVSFVDFSMQLLELLLASAIFLVIGSQCGALVYSRLISSIVGG